MSSDDLIKKIKAVGWEFVRANGSHHVFEKSWGTQTDSNSAPAQGYGGWNAQKHTKTSWSEIT